MVRVIMLVVSLLALLAAFVAAPLMLFAFGCVRITRKLAPLYVPSSRQLVMASSVGVVLSFALLALGAAISIVEPLANIMLAPGVLTATHRYGGLHGEEPLVLVLVVNALFYGVVAMMISVLWVRFRRSHQLHGT